MNPLVTTKGAIMTQARKLNTEGTSEQACGERRLWTAVILTAVEDWRNGPLRAQRKAQQFLFEDDKDFARVCDGAGLEPGSFRVKLLNIGHCVNKEGSWKQPLTA
jgi:hypothetical protein